MSRLKVKLQSYNKQRYFEKKSEYPKSWKSLVLQGFQTSLWLWILYTYTHIYIYIYIYVYIVHIYDNYYYNILKLQPGKAKVQHRFLKLVGARSYHLRIWINNVHITILQTLWGSTYVTLTLLVQNQLDWGHEMK